MKNDIKSTSVSTETVAAPNADQAQAEGLDLKIKRVRVTSKVKAGAKTWSGGCSCFSSWED